MAAVNPTPIKHVVIIFKENHTFDPTSSSGRMERSSGMAPASAA